MNYTTIEQSKHLLELGLKPGTCDKVWVSDKGAEVEFTVDLMDEEDYGKYVYTYPNDIYIPCWSTGALLELMPFIKKSIDTYIPYLVKGTESWNGKTIPMYNCFYALETSDGIIEIQSFCGQSSLEAVYNMVVWLLQNNYIKTEKI